MENSEQLIRQARPGIEPAISLPALSAEPLRHWLGLMLKEGHLVTLGLVC